MARVPGAKNGRALMIMMTEIELLEAAKAEAFQRYAETSTRLHDAYWERLQAHLPEITAKLTEQYPHATVSTKRTQWTNEGEFFFDHWVHINLHSPLSFEDEPAVYDWIYANIPLIANNGVCLGIEGEGTG